MKSIILCFASLFTAIAGHAAPVPLFDGRTLDGWDYDPKMWRIEDGTITGGSRTDKITHNDFICTKRSFRNFELKLKIKVSGDPATGMLNSGIQIRSVRVPGGAHMSGYQVDCGKGWFGKIYDEARRNKVVAEPVDAAALEKAVDVYGWNEYRIRAEGPRIQTWINGVLAIDYTELDKNIALDGQIGPQVHSGGVCLVQVKDVTIEELPPTPDAPTWESLGGVEAARKLVAPPPKPKAKPADAPKNQGAGAPSPRQTPSPASGPFQNVPGRKRDTSYNAVQGTAKTAQEQQKLFRLPDGFEIELVVQESDGIGKFVSVYFDQRGRMWTQTAFEYPVDANENPAAAEALYKSKGKDKVLVYPRESVNGPIPAGGLTSPTVFTDGLAIPLGILPWGNGDTCYIQHGHDLKLFKDTNGDGKADTSEVILTGFGVQDSHLFPHQFTRAPGGWIWMAQGLFNNSKAQKPGSDKTVDWPKCSMAKMRPDGSEFEVTSTGPNNIWGLVITGEGEAFIQEANDYGYPVMPFHEYAYYPGGMEALKKSYQPDFPPQAEFRMGGTGLSGLALGEGAFRKLTPTVKGEGLCMFVANPITSKVQTLAMHRDGPYWKLEQAPDLITCDDPFFRPVAMTNGPDGCIYIVDWYNKIISHNEVPRAHPDRDKTRGRIWRVKAKSTPKPEIPDFTKFSTDELVALLGVEPVAKAHLAWQTLVDRRSYDQSKKLLASISSPRASVPRIVQSLWALTEMGRMTPNWAVLQDSKSGSVRRELARCLIGETQINFLKGDVFEAEGRRIEVPENASIRWEPTHEALNIVEHLAKDGDPGTRFEAIKAAATFWSRGLPRDGCEDEAARAWHVLASSVQPVLSKPTAQSSRSSKQIPVREAYDREFERYLVRFFMEGKPDIVAQMLDSDAAAKLPVEARLLATLALEPKAGASRVAALLPRLTRPPEREEVLRLVQFLDEPGVAGAVRATLANAATAPAVLDALLELRSKLDPAKLAPLVTESATKLLASNDAAQIETGVKLAGAFKLASLEDALASMLERVARASGLPADASRVGNPNVGNDGNANGRWNVPGETPGTAGATPALPVSLAIVRALGEIGSAKSDLFASLATSAFDPLLRDEALAVLASSRAADAPARVLVLYSKLAPQQRRIALDKLTTTKTGAKAVVAAVTAGTLAKTDIDAAALDRMLAVLGDKDGALDALVENLGTLFRPVLALDGTDNAFAETGLALEGPFTVETWVKLDPGIGNADGILGAPGQFDLNFFAGQFRVWAGPALHDVAVAKRKIVPDMWTHVAATRDAAGIWKLYLDGELDATGTKPAGHKIESARIGWTGARGGTKGMLAEFRIWKGERTADEIRANFDRAVAATPSAVAATPSAVAATPSAVAATPSSPSVAATPRRGENDGEGAVLLLNCGGGAAAAAWGKPAPGAKVTRTSDLPPVLTAEVASQLDAKFSKYRSLAGRPGDIERGKAAALVCQACHLFGTTGGQIGPNLSGVGAMGTEAILRNILTPNAAMEAGYRIYRVEQRDGSVLDAFFVSEDRDVVVIRLPGAADQRIAKKEIVRTSYLRRSLMAEGLLDGMTDQQVSDLFAYLHSLK